MGIMKEMEYLLVFGIVAAAAFFLMRPLLSRLSGKKPARSCSTARCPLAETCARTPPKDAGARRPS